MTASRDAADDFHKAANDTLRVQTYNRPRIEREAAEGKARRPRLMEKAFQPYAEILAPILHALTSLPPDAEGNKFLLRFAVETAPDPYTAEYWPKIDIWLAYSQEVAPHKPGEAPTVHNPFRSTADIPYEEQLPTRPKLGDRPLFHMRQDDHFREQRRVVMTETWREEAMRVELGAPDTPYYRVDAYDRASAWHVTMADVPAALGAWVALAAPERLEEIQKLDLTKLPEKPLVPPAP